MQRILTRETRTRVEILSSLQVYCAMFFMYSMIGWVCEEVFCRALDGYWENRGFLYGPYLPIYGVGAVMMSLLLRRFRDRPVQLFLMAGLLSSILEYISGWVMETIWGRSWWDYSQAFLNIDGRVCLRGAVLFAIAGLLLVYLIEPVAKRFITGYMATRQGQILFFAFGIIFMVDLILTMGFRYN